MTEQEGPMTGERLPSIPLHKVVEEVAQRTPDKTALIFLGQRFSYRRFVKRFHRFASALHTLQVRDGDTVGVYLPNLPQSLIASYAISKTGGVILLLSALYTAEELTFALLENRVRTVICSDVNAGNIMRIREKVGLERIIITRLDDELPIWKRVIGRGFDRIPNGHIPQDSGVYAYRALMRRGPAPQPEGSVNVRDKVLFILYTGGTTGTAKGVPHTHYETLSALGALNEFYRGFLDEGEEVWCGYQPFYHMAGFLFLNNPLVRGETLIVYPSPNVDVILTDIKRRKITCIAGVPTFFNSVLSNERLEQYLPYLKALKYLSTGADALPADVFNRWKKVIGHELLQTWGASETFVACHNRIGEADLSLGEVLPGFELAILDSEENRFLPEGELGELAVKSQTTIRSYVNKPEETKEALVKIGHDIWYRTGDIGKRERHGDRVKFYFIDRKREIIKYKGYNIGASEVEQALYAHAAVKEAAVIGIPDKYSGEVLKAVVVLREDAKNVTFHDLLEICREKLSPYKVPKYIEFRDALPKSTHTGKILKRELRAEEILKREQQV